MKRIALLIATIGITGAAAVVGSGSFAHHKPALNWGPPVTASMVVQSNWVSPVTKAMVHPVPKH
jgi:hypothetical protein